MEIIVNGQNHSIDESATVADLLSELDLTKKFVAVEVNRELVPKGRHPEHRLCPGDVLEIVALVGGG